MLIEDFSRIDADPRLRCFSPAFHAEVAFYGFRMESVPPMTQNTLWISRKFLSTFNDNTFGSPLPAEFRIDLSEIQ